MSYEGTEGMNFDHITAYLGDVDKLDREDGLTADGRTPIDTTSLPVPDFSTAPMTGAVLPQHMYAGASVKPKRTLSQRCTDWLTSRTGIQTLSVSLGVPGLVTFVGEVSVDQGDAVSVYVTGGVLLAGGVAALAKSVWSKPGGLVARLSLGASVLGGQLVLTAMDSGWYSFVGYVVGAAGASAARVLYANNRAEPDAKLATERAKANLLDAKAQTEAVAQYLKVQQAAAIQMKMQQALAASMPMPVLPHGLSYSPTFRGDERADEAALLEVFTPGRWADLSTERGLDGTSVIGSHLTDAGVVVDVRLDGRWDADKLAKQEGSIRALAGIATGTRLLVEDGARGDVARILLRTRSASDGMSLTWTPAHNGVGVCEITGEVVDVALKPGNHVLAAGITGMGKSTAWRPLAMQAIREGWAVVLLDPKRQEAAEWSGKIRTVGDQDGDNDSVRQGIFDTLSELVVEMQHRQRIATGAEWAPSEAYPNLLVVIEEGRQLVQMDADKRWAGTLAMVDDLYTLARAVGMQLVWATQYPSRSNGGITAMVSENSVVTIALTVDGPTSDRVIFGENAQSTGWTPSELDGIPGRAMVKATGRKPNPARIWYVTGDRIQALPDVTPWASKVDPKASAKAAPVEAPDARAARIKAYAAVNPGVSQRALAEELSVPQSAVSRALSDRSSS